MDLFCNTKSNSRDLEPKPFLIFWLFSDILFYFVFLPLRVKVKEIKSLLSLYVGDITSFLLQVHYS